jgi:hypothetical protein
MRDSGGRFTTRKPAGVGAEGVEEDVFGGTTLGLAGAIHTTASLGDTDLDPVGGAITGARETGGVHQGFQQKRLDLIGSAPVLGKLAGGVGQEMAGQMGNAHPGEGSYIIPIILKRSPFIINGILSMDILLLCMSERRHARECISIVVFRTVLPSRFRPGW